MVRHQEGRFGWLKFLSIWTAVGLFFSVQIYLDYAYARQPLTWPQAAFLALSEWYVWAALSPAVLALARRFPFGSGRWLRSILVHLPATLLLTVVKLAVHIPLVDLSGIQGLQRANLETFNVSLLTCWLIVGACHAIVHYRTSQERMRRALELEAHLTRARLQLLQAQLEPHFLFNTLHSIGTLMHRDVEAAEAMLVRLSDLLRMALDHGERQQVPLATEIEFTRLYLGIQEMRFRDRLAVSFDLDPDALLGICPAMILQPLVENAVRHGVEATAARGTVSITARREGDRLRLTVTDNGPGLRSRPDRDSRVHRSADLNSGGRADAEASGSARRGDSPGVGLANTRARLEMLYDRRQRLELADVPSGGLRVTVEIPFEPALDREIS